MVLEELRNETCKELFPIQNSIEDNSAFLRKQNFTIDLISDMVGQLYQQNCTVVLSQVSVI